MITSAELRSRFLEFFHANGHEIVASSSLVPANDPTLLFTNAGMVQFKDVFLGQERRAYTRATTAQRCVRAGGKHNDLENVGYTARHHTFFEMLGNFSFGDYFKREAISFAWRFLTEELKLPADKLWVTVYAEDDEAADIWLEEIGVDPARFTRIGDKPGKRYDSDNFWAMGDIGPCGPCTEIFYDHGPHVPGGPPGTPEEDGDRYIEIWNLVFMQYERDRAGRLTPLPKPSVDTGMGLERLAAVMQGVHSNYEIDLFQNLMRAVAELAGQDTLDNASLRVIADHIRSCSFLVTDGVMPSNEGRGYVLRRIIRRAARHGHQLGLREPFFYRLVSPLVAEMGPAYPELTEAQARVEQVLAQEEERFAETLENGLRLLDEAVRDLPERRLPGELIFRLYDTYGFPVDLTADIAREKDLELDMAGFERAMETQRAKARAASRFEADDGVGVKFDHKTEFLGYEQLEGTGRVFALLKDGAEVEALETGDTGVVVLDRTPFYAESGGQVGDTGTLRAEEGLRFTVSDTRKFGKGYGHIGRLEEGRLSIGDRVEARVDAARRQAIVLNHSATHLLHEALRRVLGDHVEQKGSRVSPERLRFDFAHDQAVTPEQLREVEHLVNAQIRENLDAQAQVMTLDDARRSGARALFGEKYGDEVRVLHIGFSTELCGGTHVSRVGDIGLFKIVAESGVAAGVRRIEAVTGATALQLVEENEGRLGQIAELLKAGRDDVGDKLRQLVERSRQLERALEEARGKLAVQAGVDLASQAQDVGELKVLAARLDGLDAKALRETLDRLKDQLVRAVVVLGAANEDGRVTLVAGVTKNETAQIRAGDVVNQVAQQVGGKGGGRPDMAQAGGNEPEKLDAALASVTGWVSEQLAHSAA